jgi:hypothetical protein
MGCSVREVGDEKGTSFLYVNSLTMRSVLIMFIVRVEVIVALVSMGCAR